MASVSMPTEGFPECKRCRYADACGALKNRGGYCQAFKTYVRKAAPAEGQ